MIRLVGLLIVVFLVCFSYLFSRAPYETQQKLPEPVRNAAYNIASFMVDGLGVADGSFGTKLRQGIRKTTTEIMVATGQEKPKAGDGVMAMNKDMAGADFTARMIANSSFTGTKLDKAIFAKTFMDGTAFDSASLQGAHFTETVLTNSSAKGANFSNAKFDDTDLSGTMAQGAIFNGSQFNNALLSSSQFSGASFSSVKIFSSYGDRSIFFRADFSNAQITNTDFTRANFEKAVFKNAVLTNTHLQRVVLTDTDFSGADLSTVTGLRQKQVLAACGDEATIMPEGLMLPNCQEVAAARATAEATNQKLSSPPSKP